MSTPLPSATRPTAAPTYQAETRAPRLRLPAGACDSHFHIFGPGTRFPYDAGLPATPADAPKERLFALHQRLGIARGVLVQSTVHGQDLAVLEDFLRAAGGAYRGVALLPLDVSDARLEQLHALGVRGARFHFMRHLQASARPDAILAFGRRLAPLGWHLQMHFESGLVHELAPLFARSDVPVVIDHMARVDATRGAAHADFAALRALLRHAHIHVKLSGIDRIDTQHQAHPPYPDGVALARLLLEDAPTRCLWGSDWPHPNHTHIPDDAALVEALERIAPTPAQLQALLVDNPQQFYRFTS